MSRQQYNSRHRAVVPLLSGALALTGCSSAREEPSALPSSSVPSVTLVGGSVVTQSETLRDWAANADYVVVADVVDEQRIPIPIDETTDPDDQLVGRDISVVVDSVVWRAEDTPEPPPTAFTMGAFGWHKTNAGLSEMVMSGAARYEVGHTYVMALARQPAMCSVGDEPSPAQWVAIGPGGSIPADGGVLGRGELEARSVSPSDLKGLRAHYAGRLTSALRRDLDLLSPTRTHAFRTIGSPCP